MPITIDSTEYVTISEDVEVLIQLEVLCQLCEKELECDYEDFGTKKRLIVSKCKCNGGE